MGYWDSLGTSYEYDDGYENGTEESYSDYNETAEYDGDDVSFYSSDEYKNR